MSRLLIYLNGRRLLGWPLDQDTGLYLRTGFQSVVTYGAVNESLLRTKALALALNSDTQIKQEHPFSRNVYYNPSKVLYAII